MRTISFQPVQLKWFLLVLCGFLAVLSAHADAYTLTVNNGSGGGVYSNGAQVMITATNPPGMAFNRWTGDTQCVAGVFSLSTTVTMPAQDTALTATFENASNGFVYIEWSALGGFYFSADPNTGILGPVSSGKSTVAQLMYSPDAVKDNILSGSRAGAANDVVWDTITITENGIPDSYSDWAVFATSTTRGWTNGYVYALIFQDNNMQPGDWYFSTPLLALQKISGLMDPQYIEMNTDLALGDPIDGAYGSQVIAQVVLTVSGGSGSGTYTNGQQVAISANAPAAGKVFDKWIGDTQYVNNVTYTNALVTLSTNSVSLTATYKDAAVYHTLTANGGIGGAVSPTSTNVLAGNSATFVITASNYYRIASLTTNGAAVTGMSFDNGSTSTNFTWSNVQTSGVLAVTFTQQVVTVSSNCPVAVPYSWMAQQGVTSNQDAAAVLDPDVDGMKTWQEYIADTNPTNAASRLAVTSLTIVTNQVRLVWTGGSSAWQSVEYRNSLMDTNGWRAIYTNTPPTPITNILFDTSAGSATSRFYRIKAWR